MRWLRGRGSAAVHTIRAQALARCRSRRGGGHSGGGGGIGGVIGGQRIEVGRRAAEEELHWLRVVVLFFAIEARVARVSIGEVRHLGC